MRSTEVAGVFGAFVGRPDGFGSSDFAQNVDFFMLYRSIRVSGADSIKFMDFLAGEWSTFREILARVGLRSATLAAHKDVVILDVELRQIYCSDLHRP